MRFFFSFYIETRYSCFVQSSVPQSGTRLNLTADKIKRIKNTHGEDFIVKVIVDFCNAEKHASTFRFIFPYFILPILLLSPSFSFVLLYLYFESKNVHGKNVILMLY